MKAQRRCGIGTSSKDVRDFIIVSVWGCTPKPLLTWKTHGPRLDGIFGGLGVQSLSGC
jgi:hypothetical protein